MGLSPILMISCFFAVLIILQHGEAVAAGGAGDLSFDENYYVTWGNNHVSSLNQGTEIQLSMDKSSAFMHRDEMRGVGGGREKRRWREMRRGSGANGRREMCWWAVPADGRCRG
ncbi:xyloglucan:xyloglucosyl transferase [Sarracenia purpurea var. burkii]